MRFVSVILNVVDETTGRILNRDNSLPEILLQTARTDQRAAFESEFSGTDLQNPLNTPISRSQCGV